MIRNKKAISTVVATVLIILITVAAVTIIWSAVIPLFRGSLEEGTSCWGAVKAISIEGNKGFTCLGVNGTIKLQISRGSEDFDLADIQVVISTAEGISNSTNLLDNSAWGVTSGTKALPGQNEERVYTITKMQFQNATEVKIAPIVGVENNNKLCDSSSSFDLIDCA